MPGIAPGAVWASVAFALGVTGGGAPIIAVARAGPLASTLAAACAAVVVPLPLGVRIPGGVGGGGAGFAVCCAGAMPTMASRHRAVPAFMEVRIFMVGPFMAKLKSERQRRRGGAGPTAVKWMSAICVEVEMHRAITGGSAAKISGGDGSSRSATDRARGGYGHITNSENPRDNSMN